MRHAKALRVDESLYEEPLSTGVPTGGDRAALRGAIVQQMGSVLERAWCRRADLILLLKTPANAAKLREFAIGRDGSPVYRHKCDHHQSRRLSARFSAREGPVRLEGLGQVSSRHSFQ